MSIKSSLDTSELRATLGCFPTGVAVITTQVEGEPPVGVTINSLSSVSLEPPLVLWSLLASSPSIEAFRRSRYFCANILAADQEDIARRFASRIPDKFDGVSCHSSEANIPILSGCAATIECELAFNNYGGDHTIFIGRVKSFERTNRRSLLFVRGEFSAA